MAIAIKKSIKQCWINFTCQIYFAGEKLSTVVVVLMM